MKIAITVSTREAFPKALVVFRGLEQSLPLIAELGYDGVEVAVFHKDNIQLKNLKSLLKRYSLALPVFSTGQMYTVLNVWFTHPEQEVRQKATRIFKGIIDLASEFGADVNISRVRGYIHEEDSYEEGLKRLSDCLYDLSGYAEPIGVRLLLEQMNMFETNYLHSVREVGDYIKTLNIHNLLIHADTFHMNIHDIEFSATLQEYGPILGYIHFSDSNRRAPGQGHIDFISIIQALEEMNYPGWIGVEVLAEPGPLEAARLSIEYLKKLK